jgi:ribosomal protein S17
MTKTIVVRVERRFPHPRYKKIVTAYKKVLRARRKERGEGRRPRAHRGNAPAVQD